ncbi:MAG TPA: class III lanthionine synthetase LanKC [Acidimicrobiales bacterium]
MNNDYEAYCLADPLFYEAPAGDDAADSYAIGRRPAPHLWVKADQGDWVALSPEDHELPSQGWKVHVSGRLDNAERILATVWDYCVRRHVPFKFLRSARVVLARNAKYAGRGGSGKLVTIYPRDEDELRLVCTDLDAALAGETGPYILSDLRWGAGPVHVRYGGFTPRHCLDEHGERVLAIEDADGRLVPDRRGPVFSVPAWVPLPACLEPHLAARNATTLADLPYVIEQALHFSNGGGVYLGHAVDRPEEKLVLKEARPHAGLSGDGTDAVTRLRRERDALRRLDGVAGVPRLVDHLTVGEHEFLVMEHVEGTSLNAELARRCPLLGKDLPTPEAMAAYAAWAQGVHAAVAEVVAAIHDRGIVYGDLHMFNVLVRPDGRVCLIDFEVAADVGDERRPTLGAVGYVAPRDRHGFDIDRYALACLQLALFVPLERLIGLDRRKAAHLADVVAATFPVPRAWLDRAVEVITGAAPHASAPVPGHWHLAADDGGWPLARAAIADALLASASPGRRDRLFPGDILQFRTGGLNLAHGAAGVLYALDVTGAGRHPHLEEWLVDRLHDPVPAPGSGSDPEARLGLYDGAHGVAHVLAHLGHTEEAVKVLDAALDRPWRTGGPDLHSGLAGIGCNLLHLGTALGDPALHDAAFEAVALVADRVARAADAAGDGPAPDFPTAGLMRGATGPALLFLRAHEHTGDPALLDLAATALRLDLRRCVTLDDGQVHVDEGTRTLPYLALGSGGIALVARRLLAHRDDEELATAVDGIRQAAQALFYVQPGLFNGRAGMLLVLADDRQWAAATPAADPAGAPSRPGPSPLPDPSPEAADQVRRLGWHALTYRDGLAFPGDQLLRLSMDLATGGAGVLLALGAALHDRPVHLPFLGPPAPGAGPDGAPGSPTDEHRKGGDEQ